MRTANAQADLSLRWVHMPFCSFCHEAAHPVLMIERVSGKNIQHSKFSKCFYRKSLRPQYITGEKVHIPVNIKQWRGRPSAFVNGSWDPLWSRKYKSEFKGTCTLWKVNRPGYGMTMSLCQVICMLFCGEPQHFLWRHRWQHKTDMNFVEKK